MGKYGSLPYQVTENLKSKLRIGESKHAAKLDGTAYEGIYSYKTYTDYAGICIGFTQYCKSEHSCKTLDDCREYVTEYLNSMSDKSAWTQKARASALAKLYGCKATDFKYNLLSRKRENIVRTRRETKSAAHFSEENHSKLVNFCKSTGLRRREVAYVRGTDLVYNDDGEPCIHVRNGKGGKKRKALIIGPYTDEIVSYFKKAGTNKVFDKVPQVCPVHKYRGEYARTLYNKLKRPLKDIPAKEQYHCRNDLRGVTYDRVAMLTVSQSLGHNRISVIAYNYLT